MGFLAWFLLIVTIAFLIVPVFIGTIIVGEATGWLALFFFLSLLGIGLAGLFVMFQWQKRGNLVKHLGESYARLSNGGRVDEYIVRIFRESPHPLLRVVGIFVLIPMSFICALLLIFLLLGLLGQPEYPWNMIQWAIPSCSLVVCLAVITKWLGRGGAKEIVRMILWAVGPIIGVALYYVGKWPAAIGVWALTLILLFLLTPWKKD